MIMTDMHASAQSSEDEDSATPNRLTLQDNQASESSQPLATAKRSRDEADDNNDEPDAEALSKMSRSERKRHREKKRRVDVNKGFDELMTLLLEIDPVVRQEAEEKARRGQWKGAVGAQEDNLLSRVSLINRTVEVLKRVHHENEERKLIIEHMSKNSSAPSQSSGGICGTSLGMPPSTNLRQHAQVMPPANHMPNNSSILAQQLFQRNPSINEQLQLQSYLLQDNPGLSLLQSQQNNFGISQGLLPMQSNNLRDVGIANNRQQLAILQRRMQEREAFARLHGIDLSGNLFSPADPNFRFNDGRRQP